MKKFLVLYHSTVPAREQMAKSTPEQAKAGMDLWMSWMKSAGSALVDGGAPLAPVGSASWKVAGYSIIQAKDAAAAEALMKDHPHLKAPGGTIELHEAQAIPGM